MKRIFRSVLGWNPNPSLRISISAQEISSRIPCYCFVRMLKGLKSENMAGKTGLFQLYFSY